MLKILLIDAVDTDSAGKPFETACESLSLPFLAAYLRENIDSLEIRIVDRNVSEEITRFMPDVVGISFVTVNFFIAQRYAKIARENGAKVVGGGPHISSAPFTLPSEIDIGVVGEGERTLLELVRAFPNHHWESKAELAAFPGIVFHAVESNRIVNKARPVLDLDDLPMPARDLFFHKARGIMTSRGCPYKCSFCFRAHLENKVRYVSPKKVVAEILHLVEAYKARHVHIYDDLFTLPKARFDYVVDALSAEGIPKRTSFNCNLRPDLVNENLARQLRRLNVTGVFLGVESGVQRVLSYLKPQSATVTQNERAIRILNENGICTKAGIIIGSPDETKEEIIETLSWIHRSELDEFEVLLLTPLPGTKVWEDAQERGLVSYEMDWSRLDLRADEIGEKEPVIMSKVIPKEEVISIYEMYIRERDRFRKANSLSVTAKTIANLVRHPQILFHKLGSLESYKILLKLLGWSVSTR